MGGQMTTEAAEQYCAACEQASTNMRYVLTGLGLWQMVCRECVEAWADAWEGVYRENALYVLEHWDDPEYAEQGAGPAQGILEAGKPHEAPRLAGPGDRHATGGIGSVRSATCQLKS